LRAGGHCQHRQLVGNALFGTDYLASGGASAFSPSMFEHYPSQGPDCIFKDESAQFVQSVPVFNFITTGNFIADETQASREE
jgi:hypothetical protein